MADNQVSETTPIVDIPTQDKKRIIKKKVLKRTTKVGTSEANASEVPTTSTDTTAVVNEPVVGTETSTETVAETEDEKDSGSIIPSSRIKNYINKEKLNKEIDSLIHKIKESDSSLDLNSILSEEVQKKIGSLIKEKEKLNNESPDTASVINVNEIAVEILSKLRYKFSNNSFKVLSVFSDMVIEEITKFAMDELVKNKKSIINNKYVFSSKIASGKLYKIYSGLPSFIAMQSEVNSTPDTSDEVATEEVASEEVATEEVASEEAVSSEKACKTINFEFYIRKICNKLKVSDDVYSKIKVSEKYQKFCSNIILDLLDRIAPLSKIVLEVMTTKTITNLVFQTIIKMQLWESPDYDVIIEELYKRLETKK